MGRHSWVPDKGKYTFRNIIRALYKYPDTTILRPHQFDFIEVDGFRYKSSDQLMHTWRFKGNPWFSNIKPDDIVLDIGANIGTICIPLASVARRVYALEPLFVEELRKNIELNNCRNIEILEGCLDTHSGSSTIAFMDRSKVVRSYSFKELKSITGRIDFLQVDCEGKEWTICPEDLRGIRELRIELNLRWFWRDHKSFSKLVSWLDINKYGYTIRETGDIPRGIAHILLLNASLEGTSGRVKEY